MYSYVTNFKGKIRIFNQNFKDTSVALATEARDTCTDDKNRSCRDDTVKQSLKKNSLF